MTRCASCPMVGYGALRPIMPSHYRAGCQRCDLRLHWSEPGACRHQFTTQPVSCGIECRTLAACGVYPANRALSVRDVTPELISGVRAYVIAAREESQGRARPLTRDNFVTFIADMYCGLQTPFVVWPGEEVFLDLSVLEGPSVPYWVRDFLFTTREPGLKERIKLLTRPRIAVIASILRAVDPVAASPWEMTSTSDVVATLSIGQTVLDWMDRPASFEFSEGAGSVVVDEEWDDLPF